MIDQLSFERLRWNFNQVDLANRIFQEKTKIKQTNLSMVTQERALSALELGLGIPQRGFNIFVVGYPGTGRTSAVKQILKKRAEGDATPDDIVLLYNFNNRDRPLAVSLPASYGPKIKKAYETLIERIINNLEKAFESDLYNSRRQGIQEKCHSKTTSILANIETEAEKEGFVLSKGTGSLTLTPANEQGQALTEDEFDLISEDHKRLLEQSAEKLEARLEESIRRIRSLERQMEEDIENLERETAQEVITPLFDAVKQSFKLHKPIMNHLKEMQEDVLNRCREIIPDERKENQDKNSEISPVYRYHLDDEEYASPEHVLVRYQVNVLVTHHKEAGAPVVHETHPTTSNLIGRIEQRLKGGETITDHTRIRPGALYLANGGYLVLEAQDLLRDPSAWEGLKRALKNHAVELDDPGEPGRMVSVASLRPEPVKLTLKVVLIGPPEIYYGLSRNDPDFSKLFKVKADFDIEVDRSDDRIQKYLHFLVSLCQEENLKSLTALGAGKIMEQAVRLAGNQKKLTTRLSELADLVREAHFWAVQEASKKIDAHHVMRALAARKERNGYLEATMVEDILEGRVHIETQGQVVGQCNALTVIELGNYEFGVPLRVTCRVSSGRGEIVDIERETQLGGPIHTKGTLIIRGLLADRFGLSVPLGFTAHICMEQTYTDIDGDSASLAEACALFSVLSGYPIRQDYALTGSIDQRGQVQAVGGINEKIEGFFQVCKSKKDPMPHGVIIPKSNENDLMLSEAVVEACRLGDFYIISVENCDEALQVLTGKPFEGGENSLRFAIERTLEHLHDIRRKGNMHMRSRVLQQTQKGQLALNAKTPI